MRVSFLYRVVVCMLLLQFCALAQGQGGSGGNSLWTKTFSKEEGIENILLSPHSKYAILGFGFQMSCVNTIDGKVLWSKRYDEDYTGKHDLVCWVDSSTVIVPTNKTIDWVEASSGKILGSVPLLSETLEGLKIEGGSYQGGFIALKPKRFGNVLFVPFEEGYYLLDIVDKKILHKNTEEPERIFVEHWGNHVLFYSHDMDEAVVFNSVERKIVYKHSRDIEEFESMLYQHMIQHNNALALFLNDNLLCVNSATGKKIGTIELEVGDLFNYSPIVLDDKLFLLVQQDEELNLYDIQTAKKVWTAAATEDEAKLMKAYTIGDNQILAFTFSNDEQMFVRSIDGKKGTTNWNRLLCEADYEYNPGIRYEIVRASTGGMYAGSVIVSNRGYGTYKLDSNNVHTYFKQTGHDSTAPYNERMRTHLFANDCVRMEEKSGVQGMLLYENPTTLVLGILGHVNAAWGKEVEDDENGEGVLVLNKATGAVQSVTRVPFKRDKEATKILFSSAPLLYNNVKTYRYPTGTVLFGSHTIAHVDETGKVDTLGFNSKDISRNDVGVDYISISTSSEDEDQYATWKIKLEGGKLGRSLISMSDESGYLSIRSDTTYQELTLRYNAEDNKLSAYEIMSDIPQKWPAPKWSLSSDDIKKLNVGEFHYDNANIVAGIRHDKKRTYILGEEGLGVIDNATGCATSVKWDGEGENTGGFKRGLITIDDYIVFQLNSDIGIGSVDNCKVTMKGRASGEDEKILMVFDEHYKIFLFMNAESNRVDLYKL